MKAKLTFISKELEESYNELDENDFRKKAIRKAILKIQNNTFCGVQIPKRLIPKDYFLKYNVTNLWKLNMPNGWRLIYTITNDNEVEILSAILEWMSHPEYEKRFKY